MPKLTEHHIDGYFRYRVATDAQPTSDIKAIQKGEKLVDARKVYACSIQISQPNIYLSGVVGAAMKKKIRYSFKLKMDTKTAEIKNSHCECPSGKGPHGTCKHIAAVLLMLEKFIKGENVQIAKTCTEDLQTFHVPKQVYEGSPIKAADLPSKRKCTMDDPRPEKYRNAAGYEDHVRNVVINYCSEKSKDLTIRYLWPKADIKAAIKDHSYLERSFTEYWVEDAVKVTEAQAVEIEASTRQQAQSSKWFQTRKWRLTASRFGDICNMTNRRNKEKLCKSLVTNMNLTNPAVIHGRQYESAAIKKFESEYKMKVGKAGLFVCIEKPYLAATPDGVIDADTIIEVKCPYKGRNCQICPGQLFPFLTRDKDGDMQLKRQSKYYMQVQGQLYISKRKYCFFIVYTFEDMFVEKIRIDEDYCDLALLRKLELFYEMYFRKYIASHF